MTDREKVMNGLECLSNENNICSKNTCPYYMFESCVPEISHDALELLKKHPQWIRVEDRLPEVGKVVLAFGTRSATTGMFQGVCKRNDRWLWKKHTIKHVSHWMPLPEPPKEVEQDD